MADLSDLELLGALGVETQTKKKAARTPREERVIAGFEEIQRFVEQQGHAPQHGEDRDIFERLYAVRLERISQQAECRELVSDMDYQGLLDDTVTDVVALDDAELLSELGIAEPKADDMTHLQHVKPRSEINAAEEVAARVACKDFETFKPLFERVQNELNSGGRETRPFKDQADIKAGDWFILSGQKVYVAEMGEAFINDYGRKDSRLRAIYDNGTEIDILLRSLQRALNKDETGRRIIEISHGPLFEGTSDDKEESSGTIYVLRSKANYPMIEENRQLIHKIGVTSGSIEKRIANASADPTFLLADVEVVASYKLRNINRSKLENILHTFFDAARLKIEIPDRFGKPVSPREWFIVPVYAIDEAVERIQDGSIGQFRYDLVSASLKIRGS